MGTNNNLQLKRIFNTVRVVQTLFRKNSNRSKPRTSTYVRPKPRPRDISIAWSSLDDQIKEQLKRYLQEEVDWSILIGLRGDKAKTALKVIQALNDDDDLWEEWLQLPAQYRQDRLIHLEVKLSQESGELPGYLFVQATNVGQHAVFGGGCADVYRGKLDGHVVALKCLRFFTDMSEEDKKTNAEHFAREALMWIHLKHPNVMPLCGIDIKRISGTPCMVMPWVEDTNIRNYMKNNEQIIDVNQLNAWIIDIARGLGYLHSRGIIHGDLRGANILMMDKVARLTDFGLAVFEGEFSRVYKSHRGGVFHWLAPEILKPDMFHMDSTRPTAQSDVYSFAMVCYEIYARQAPFHGCLDSDIINKVTAEPEERPPRPCEPTPMNDDMFKLVKDCWARHAGDRLTISRVLERLQQ